MQGRDKDRANDENSRSREGQRFSLLWTISACGYLAGWIMKFALPVFAAQATSSPFLVSGVAFSMTAPWLLFGLQAGVLVDRLDRRKIMIFITMLRIITLGLITITAALSTVPLPLLYGVALILGIADTFMDTSMTAMLPMVIPHAQLEKANARLVGASMAIEIIALPLGGALTAIGLSMAVGFGSICYLLALGALLLLRGTFRPERVEQHHIRAEVIEGLRFLRNKVVLGTIGLMSAVLNACWSAWLSVLVIYAITPGPVGLTPFGYGILLTASGVGGLIGTVSAVPVQRWLGRRWAFGINILGNAIMYAAPALTTNPWILGAAIVIGGLGGPMWGITAVSLQQRMVPNALQGRVDSAYRFLAFGAAALGPLIGGSIAQFFGITVVFLGCALLTLLMMIPFLRIVTEESMALAQPPTLSPDTVST
jgi:MFS family permease